METPAEVTPKVEPTVEAEATEAVPVPLPVAAPEPTTGGVSVPAPEPTPDTAQPSSAQPLPPGVPVMGAMPLPANVPMNGAVAAEGTSVGMIGEQMAVGDEDEDEDDEAGDGSNKRKRGGHGRRKIEIEYIEDKIRRHITFSKRKAGISKKAFELSRLTGAQVLLLISSERGQIYSFATPKLQPILVNEGSKALIEQCLNAPDPMAPQPVGQMMPPMMEPVPGSMPQHYDPSQMQMPPGQMPQMMMPPGYQPVQQMPQYEQHMAGAGTLIAMQPDGSMGQMAAHGYMIGPDGQYMAMIPQQPPMQQH